MRKVAGEASCATLNGRMTTKSVSDDCAPKCRRRNDSGRTLGSQNSKAAIVPLRSTCSAVQSASAVFRGRSHIKRSDAIPQQLNPSEFGTCGGWSKAIGQLRWQSKKRLAQKPQFANATLLDHQLDQAAYGPAASGQLLRQGAVPVSSTLPCARASWLPFHSVIPPEPGYILSSSRASIERIRASAARSGSETVAAEVTGRLRILYKYTGYSSASFSIYAACVSSI
jgi:hypothetical protein